MKKEELCQKVEESYERYGGYQTAQVIDSVKRLGYAYASKSGLTVSVSDCIVPEGKKRIIKEASERVTEVEKQSRRGLLTEKERYNKVIGIWNRATEEVTVAMMENMEKTNPIYMMAASGARGNKQQMRQLAGMRGLMADPSGKIIDLPITANFREGLSVSDYFISSHGARKGLADTALRTADSGYLTRRLVDVAQDVLVRSRDCDEKEINLMLIRAQLSEDTFDALEQLSESLMGRVLAEGVSSVEAETILDEESLIKIGESGAKNIVLRGSGLSGNSRVRETIKLGAESPQERAKIKDRYLKVNEGKELARPVIGYEVGYKLTKEALEEILKEEKVKSITIRENKIRGIEISAITESGGEIESLKDRIMGRTLAENVYDGEELIGKVNDRIDRKMAEKISAIRTKVKIRSILTCRSSSGVCQKCYGEDLANRTEVEIGEAVGIIAAQSIGEPGTQLTMRTFHTGGVAGGDITQGLPRVEELFEARKPKNSAQIAEISGKIKEGEPDKNGLRTLIIEPVDPENEQEREYSIPYGITPRVKIGEEIQVGDRLTDGAKNPHDILRILGLQETQRYLVKEVQKVYKSQGVEINDKHIEVMVRQMLHKVTSRSTPQNSSSIGWYWHGV